MSIICDGIISSCGDTEAYLATSDPKTINGGVTFTSFVVVQGSITTDAAFVGDGSGITALNAGNISTGTLPVARGGTGITSFGTGVATALGANTNTANGAVTLAGLQGATFSSIGVSLGGSFNFGTTGPRVFQTGNLVRFLLSDLSTPASISFANGTASGAIIPGSFTFATRPTVATGGIVTITDGALATPGVIAAGGGSNNIAIRFNGTNWIVL